MLILALACATSPSAPSRPQGVPQDAVAVAVVEGQLLVDGAPVAPWEALDDAPTDEQHPALVAALERFAGRPLWIALPPDAPFWKVRKVLGSAKIAGTGPGSFLSATGADDAFPLVPPPKYGLATSCEQPVHVSGAIPLVTLSLQTGGDGQWVLATARFLPKTPRGAVDGLPAECLAVPSCDTIWQPGWMRDACVFGAGTQADQRVGIGGEHGCLLPIARTPDEVARWRAELPDLLRRLELGDDLLLLMPEARTRHDALLAVLGGFVDAGLRAPHVGITLLVEGNDGPPICNAVARDAMSLDAAGARWVGSLIRADEAPAGERRGEETSGGR